LRDNVDFCKVFAVKCIFIVVNKLLLKNLLIDLFDGNIGFIDFFDFLKLQLAIETA